MSLLKMCTREWAKPMLEDPRAWMSEKEVPWMLHVYARGAMNGLVFLFVFLFYDPHCIFL